MKIVKYRDLLTGIIFLGLSAGLYIMSLSLPESLMGGLGSDFMPKVLAVLTGCLSLIQIINGIRNMKSYVEEKEEDTPEYGRVLITVLVFLAYVLLFKPVGFLISTSITLFLLMGILAPKEKRNYLLFVVISLVFTVAVYYLFRNALNVMLPKGILG